MCAVCWGRCSLVGVLFMSGLVFSSSCFQFSVIGGLGGSCPVVVSVFALRLVLFL